MVGPSDGERRRADRDRGAGFAFSETRRRAKKNGERTPRAETSFARLVSGGDATLRRGWGAGGGACARVAGAAVRLDARGHRLAGPSLCVLRQVGAPHALARRARVCAPLCLRGGHGDAQTRMVDGVHVECCDLILFRALVDCARNSQRKFIRKYE